jgi:hypothetical protein
LARSQSSRPAARAAVNASTTDAAKPLKKTLRNSFRVAAAPGPGTKSRCSG